MERCETFHDYYRIEVYTLFALTVTLRYEKTPVGPEHIHSGPTGVFFDHGIAASE